MAGIIVLLINVAAVLFMCGNVWVRQIVYYPLYAYVGLDAFPNYQRENGRRVERIIQPAHAAMALSSLLLLLVRPPAIPLTLAAVGVALQLVAGAATAYEVPRQLRLARGFDSHVHRELLQANWARTAAISVHAAVVLWMVWLVANA